jgi:spermidine synthase
MSGMPRIEFDSDIFSPHGLTLLVDGEAQSHVDAADPTRLFFEYVRRIGHVVDSLAAPGAPIRALHLGGGALTLPRYVEATRPGSAQVVIDHDADVLEVVQARLPLPHGADITLVVADAAATLSRSSERSPDTPSDGADTPVPAPNFRRLANSGTAFDLVVIDLYTGLEPPSFVATTAFAADVLATLAPNGVVAVNVADAAGLARLGAQARAFARAAPAAQLLVAGSPAVLAGFDEGNAVLIAAPGGLPAGLDQRLRSAGPHPVEVLTADRLDFVVWGSC